MYDVAFLERFRTYLYKKTNKWYFKNIRDNREDILCTCPIHKEGQENHPSCGFSKVDKDTISAGWFHCFNCGFVGNVYKVAQELLGTRYDKEELRNVLGLEDIEIDNRLNPKSLLFTIPPDTRTNYVSREELKRYRIYHDYLKNRGITKETAEKYDLGFDKVTNDITFPIRDETGGTLAVGRRSILEKKYDYPSGFTKPLYGVYELPSVLNGFEVWVQKINYSNY